MALQTISAEGAVTLPWIVGADASSTAVKWNVQCEGCPCETASSAMSGQYLASIADTALLFQAELSDGVTQDGADRNRHFLSTYAGVDMPLRGNVTEVILDESDIHSDGFFASVAAALIACAPGGRLRCPSAPAPSVCAAVSDRSSLALLSSSILRLACR